MANPTTRIIFIGEALNIVPALQAACDAQNALGFRLVGLAAIGTPNLVGFILAFDK